MVVTTRIRLDRISSSTKNAALPREVIVGDDITAEEGYGLAVRILADKSSYNTIEDPTGRMLSLRAGDVLAGTLGARRALRGYAGGVPERLAVGEVLRAILAFPELGDRIGRPAHIKDHAIPPADRLESTVPVVYVAGTCMNAGKTVAATELVRGLTRGGLRVGAAKLTGVALMRDALSMLDAGASVALTFNDAGAASTHAGMAVPVAKAIMNRLAAHPSGRPDVIVAELGDGILGDYGVQDILRDAELMGVAAAHVVCAPDPVGCWGVAQLYRDQFELPITAISGPATDNDVGREFVRSTLGVPAYNARREAERLVEVVREALTTP